METLGEKRSNMVEFVRAIAKSDLAAVVQRLRMAYEATKSRPTVKIYW